MGALHQSNRVGSKKWSEVELPFWRENSLFFENIPCSVARAHVDAPVSGGPASRKLAIWVGGDENVFNKHRAVLDAIGDKAACIGPIGSATVAKLVHNISGYAIVCALAETFTMGVKAGVETRPCGATMPSSARCARNALISWVR
jgi:3-hydroxyisobutyrate dehydrogenase-like beta-hydroxyacid dehydrogenase